MAYVNIIRMVAIWMMLRKKNPTKVASPTEDIEIAIMDNSAAFAKARVNNGTFLAAVAQDTTDYRNTVYTRSNMVLFGESMYAIAMSTDLLQRASDYYLPSLYIDYEQNSDYVWGFISDTNKSKE